MKIRLLAIVGLVAASLLSLHSAAQHYLHQRPAGTNVKDHFAAGKSNVFLPEGTWTLIGASETTTWPTNSTSRTKWADLWLAHMDGKDLRGLVRVRTSLNVTQLVWTGAVPCDRTDVLLTRYFLRSVQDSSCMVINHHTDVLKGKGQEGSSERRAYLWLEENSVRVPATMIVVSYHRSSRNGDLLNLFYYFNPEHDGLPPSGKAGWSVNDWHKKFIDRDEKRVAYLDAMKSWAIKMAPVVETGYRRGLAEPGTYARWPLQRAEAQADAAQTSPEVR